MERTQKSFGKCEKNHKSQTTFVIFLDIFNWNDIIFAINSIDIFT